MTDFASDTFTGGTANQELSLYSSNWVAITNFQNGHIGNDATTYAYAPSGLEALYMYSTAAPSADYSVFIDVKVLQSDAAWTAGAIGRYSGTDNTNITGYELRQDTSTNLLKLYKVIASTYTQLGSSVSNTIANGATQTLELRMTGTTIEGYINGSGTPSISVTDSSISSAGKAGIYMYNGRVTAVHDTLSLDNFRAASGGVATVKRIMMLGMG